jgi:endonuclease YncB( thermonuclease family)
MYIRIAASLALSMMIVSAAVTDAAQPSDSGSVIQVVDAATLDVDVAGTPERVHLAGIAADDPDACAAPDALARTHELTDGQTVRIEVDPAFSQDDRPGATLATVWLQDGRDVGEVLLSEGLARMQLTPHGYTYEQAYAAAQATALAQRIGVWSPALCPPVDPPPGLESFVTTMLDQTQAASTALNALHQQTQSASAFAPALSQPAWQQNTRYMVEELRNSATVLRSGSPPADAVQPLAEHLALVGNDLLAGANAYSLAMDHQDPALVGATDRQLQTTAESLQPLFQQLVAVAAGYKFSED